MHLHPFQTSTAKIAYKGSCSLVRLLLSATAYVDYFLLSVYCFLIKMMNRSIISEALDINAIFPWGMEERTSLIIHLENVMGFLWEGHCLLQQNNHGISVQAGERKMIHYFKNYFTVSPENRWRLLTIYKGGKGFTYYLRLCFKGGKSSNITFLARL